MDLLLKADWIAEKQRKKDDSFAGSFVHAKKCPAGEDGSTHTIPGGPCRGRVPSPCASNVTVGAKLLEVADHQALVDDEAKMETGWPGSSHDARSPKHIEQQLQRAMEKEQKQKQRTENLQKLVDHQGNLISSLQHQLAVAKADLAKAKSSQQEQNLSATSSNSTSSTSDEIRWSASAELRVQMTHQSVQCDIPSDVDEDVTERLKRLNEDREALRSAVRDFVQEKLFWRNKCRTVLDEKQALEEKVKVICSENSTMSRSCTELSKELTTLKERCADHENCGMLRESSLREIERITKMANDISRERKGLQEQVATLQNRMQSHMDKFSRLKDELQGALTERDAASARAEAALRSTQHLLEDRDHWKDRCTSALSELEQTHRFHEELGKVHVNARQEVDRYQDELVTLRAALRTQAGDVAKWEREAHAWQQRSEQLAATVDDAQERMQAGMSELRQQLESRDRIIHQQKQRLIKMPQIQADLEFLRTELKKAIVAVSNSCASSTDIERTQSSTPVSAEIISLHKGAATSSSCVYCRKNDLSDSSTSTFDNPVVLIDSSTSTSEIPVCFAESSTSTFESPISTKSSSTSTSEDARDAPEVENEFESCDIFNSNVSLLDVSVEKLDQLLRGAGDSRVKHIETQTDLVRESVGRGDAILEESSVDSTDENTTQISSDSEIKMDSEGILKFEVECRKSFEDRLEIEKTRVEDSAFMCSSVLFEVLGRINEAIQAKETEELQNMELQEVLSERDVLEILLQKETSARVALSERLESETKTLAEEQKIILERCEVEFSEKIAEVRWELEFEKATSTDFRRTIIELEATLNMEKSQNCLLENKVVSLGKVVSELTFLVNFLQDVVSAKNQKHAEVVQTFRVVTLCLRKELNRQVKRIDCVNKVIREGDENSRNFFIARVPLKRLRRGSFGQRRNRSARNIATVLRRRLKQSILRCAVMEESRDAKSKRVYRGVKWKRRRRGFRIVLSELKRNIARLKLFRDNANGVVEELGTKICLLESENRGLREVKSSLEKKLVSEEERGTVKIQALTEELAAAHDMNLQLKEQVQRVFVNLRADLETRLLNPKAEEKKKGVLSFRNEICRVQEDLEKERNRTVGAKKEAAEFNNWFHVLEDYVRNQPMSLSDEDREGALSEIFRQREVSNASKEAYPPGCPHQEETGCHENPTPSGCQLCFLKTQEVNGSNAGWAARAVHLAYECARRINQQAMAHQANLASLTAAHQRSLAVVRDSHAAALLRLQSKQNAELSRVRREARAELKTSLKTEVRANMNAVVERSLAEVEHLHRAEMKKLTRCLSNPMKIRIGRVSGEKGQQEVGYQPDLNSQISPHLPQEFDQRHARQIALFSPNPEFCELQNAGVLNLKGNYSYFGESSHLNLGDGVEREKLWQLSRELQAEKKEASRLLMVLSGQWNALRTRQACLRKWANVVKKPARDVTSS